MLLICYVLSSFLQAKVQTPFLCVICSWPCPLFYHLLSFATCRSGPSISVYVCVRARVRACMHTCAHLSLNSRQLNSTAMFSIFPICPVSLPHISFYRMQLFGFVKLSLYLGGRRYSFLWAFEASQRCFAEACFPESDTCSFIVHSTSL